MYKRYNRWHNNCCPWLFLLQVALAKPVLTLETDTPTWGQPVQMTCNISTEHLSGTFTLRQQSGSYREAKQGSTSAVDFTIPQAYGSHSGSYDCQYEITVNGRLFNSTLSNPVNFTVKGEICNFLCTFFQILWVLIPFCPNNCEVFPQNKSEVRKK